MNYLQSTSVNGPSGTQAETSGKRFFFGNSFPSMKQKTDTKSG